MPDTNQLTVVVTLTQKDYALALREIAKANSGRPKRVLFWISLAFLSLMFVRLLNISDRPFSSLGLTILALVLMVVLLRFAVPHFAARSFVRKNPHKLGPARHSIGPGGTSYEGQHGSGEMSWSAFHRIRETPDLFLLFPQTNFAQALPKRCSERPEDIQTYREIVRRFYTGKLELLT
jgi:hypothetical protein